MQHTQAKVQYIRNLLVQMQIDARVRVWDCKLVVGMTDDEYTRNAHKLAMWFTLSRRGKRYTILTEKHRGTGDTL